jgi:hypothetical protein
VYCHSSYWSSWRTATICPMSLKPDSRYDTCRHLLSTSRHSTTSYYLITRRNRRAFRTTFCNLHSPGHGSSTSGGPHWCCDRSTTSTPGCVIEKAYNGKAPWQKESIRYIHGIKYMILSLCWSFHSDKFSSEDQKTRRTTTRMLNIWTSSARVDSKGPTHEGQETLSIPFELYKRDMRQAIIICPRITTGFGISRRSLL